MLENSGLDKFVH